MGSNRELPAHVSRAAALQPVSCEGGGQREGGGRGELQFAGNAGATLPLPGKPGQPDREVLACWRAADLGCRAAIRTRQIRIRTSTQAPPSSRSRARQWEAPGWPGCCWGSAADQPAASGFTSSGTRWQAVAPQTFSDCRCRPLRCLAGVAGCRSPHAARSAWGLVRVWSSRRREPAGWWPGPSCSPPDRHRGAAHLHVLYQSRCKTQAST